MQLHSMLNASCMTDVAEETQRTIDGSDAHIAQLTESLRSVFLSLYHFPVDQVVELAPRSFGQI